MNQVAVHDLDIEIEVIGQQSHQRVDITGPEVPPHWHTPDRRVSNDEFADRYSDRLRPIPPPAVRP